MNPGTLVNAVEEWKACLRAVDVAYHAFREKVSDEKETDSRLSKLLDALETLDAAKRNVDALGKDRGENMTDERAWTWWLEHGLLIQPPDLPTPPPPKPQKRATNVYHQTHGSRRVKDTGRY